MPSRPIYNELHEAAGRRRCLSISEPSLLPMYREMPIEWPADRNCSLSCLYYLECLQEADAVALSAGAVASTAPSLSSQAR